MEKRTKEMEDEEEMRKVQGEERREVNKGGDEIRREDDEKSYISKIL